MTTCCTDSSKVMMIWMYSGDRMREIHQQHTLTASFIIFQHLCPTSKCNTAVIDFPASQPDGLCLCQWLGRAIIKHCSADGLNLTGLWWNNSLSFYAVQHMYTADIWVSICVHKAATYLVYAHIWLHSPVWAAAASPAPQGLNARPPGPDLARGNLRFPGLRPGGTEMETVNQTTQILKAYPVNSCGSTKRTDQYNIWIILLI